MPKSVNNPSLSLAERVEAYCGQDEYVPAGKQR